jgi:hypothetical protein
VGGRRPLWQINAKCTRFDPQLGITRRAMQPRHPSAATKLDFASHRLANKSCALRGRRACECSSSQLTCFRCFRSTLTSDCGAGKCESSTLYITCSVPFLQICAIEKVCAASKAFLCCLSFRPSASCRSNIH